MVGTGAENVQQRDKFWMMIQAFTTFVSATCGTTNDKATSVGVAFAFCLD